MTNGTRSESQTAFIVAAAVLLGLPLIITLGMAGFAAATGAGLIPGNEAGPSSEIAALLLLFFVVWGVVAVVAVLMFVARLLRRSSG